MNVAAKVRTEKENHPERFCSEKNCLWRVVSRDGLNPCQKHPRTLTEQERGEVDAFRRNHGL